MTRLTGILLALGSGLLAASPAAAQVSINVSVGIAPPPLPVYAQPPLPGPDYVWTPGYWAWDDIEEAYYWVPGTWVMAPRPGLLWTPPWWGWSDGAYIFHAGYWGPHVGFYGGVPYGFGYTGFGYQGGYWNGGHIFYNCVVNNITNVHITNVYQQNVVVNHITRVSYNGGPGGVQARPGRQDWIAAHEAHVAPTPNQFAHFAAARSDPRLFANINHGRPPVVATARPMAAGRMAFGSHGGGWQPPSAAAQVPREGGYRAAHAIVPGPQPGGTFRSAPAALARAPMPMPIVHRGGPPPWQRDATMGVPPTRQPGRDAPPPGHGAPVQVRWNGGGDGGWNRHPPAPHGDVIAMGGHGWGAPPHAAPPRVAFHAPPPLHAPAPPHSPSPPHDHRPR